MRGQTAGCKSSKSVRKLPTDGPESAFIGLALTVAVAHRRAGSATQHLCLRAGRDELNRTVFDDEGRGRPRSRERHTYVAAEGDTIFTGQNLAVRHGDGDRPSSNAHTDKGSSHWAETVCRLVHPTIRNPALVI